MKKVILIPDSFKGTMSSAEICTVMAQAVQEYYPDAQVHSVPVADGGEGSVDSFLQAVGGEKVSVPVKGPYFEEVPAFYGMLPDGVAVIEMAAAAGLPLVGERLHAEQTTTYGVGELMAHALERGCKRLVVGLGGSATNDGGCGAAAALGAVFRNAAGEAFVPVGATLAEVAEIDLSGLHPALASAELVTMCDIDNPLCGPLGAAHVFAPQKGADPAMVELLDAGLAHLADVVERCTGRDIRQLHGAGAAGGMGGSLHAFLDAQLKPGIELLLETLDFAEKIKDADLIITGEGKSDRQTLMGKVPSGILQEARRQHIPVILLAGAIEDAGILNAAGFRGVFSITPSPASLEQAMQPEFAQENIRRTVEQICRIFF